MADDNDNQSEKTRNNIKSTKKNGSLIDNPWSNLRLIFTLRQKFGPLNRTRNWKNWSPCMEWDGRKLVKFSLKEMANNVERDGTTIWILQSIRASGRWRYFNFLFNITQKKSTDSNCRWIHKWSCHHRKTECCSPCRKKSATIGRR